MTYAICKSESLAEFCKLATAAMKQGYKPHGGVCVVLARPEYRGPHGDVYPNTYLWSQAMVLDEAVKDE